jgi:hypothetical protein
MLSETTSITTSDSKGYHSYHIYLVKVRWFKTFRRLCWPPVSLWLHILSFIFNLCPVLQTPQPIHWSCVNATMLSPFHTYYSLLYSVVTLVWLLDCEDKAVNPSKPFFFNRIYKNC